MPSQVVTTILLDGNPQGIRLIDMANWDGQVFIVPRGKLREFRVREESHQPGIYFLFGEGKEMPTVYIGQSGDLLQRLLSHNSDREEDEWNTAFVFTGTVDSALVEYLESISIELAKKAGRYKVFNGREERLNRLSEAQKIVVAEYFERLRLIINLFGYPIFENPKELQTGEIYYCRDVNMDDANGKGTLLESGEFIVFKDSLARKEERQAFIGSRGSLLRQELLTQGILINYDPNSYAFANDYTFRSPSSAAGVVLARHANGWTGWKDEKGKTLDENKRKNVNPT